MAIPEPRYFIIDSTQVTATEKTALATYDGNYFSFTPAQNIRDTTTANIQILKTFATEAEINADGDLTNFRKANRPNATCQGCFTKLSQMRAFGFHMLGEPERATRMQAATSIIFIGMTDNGGTRDGATPYRAYSSYRDYKENAFTSWQTDTHYVDMECIYGDRTDEAGSNAFPKNTDPVFQDGDGHPIGRSMDYLDNPGLLFQGWRDTRGTSNAFTQPNAGSYPRLWYADGPYDGTILLPIDMTLSTTDLYDNHVFETVSSLAEVQSTAMSRWWDSTNSKLYIHMPDDTDPSDRIGTEGHLGWAWAHSYMQASTRYKGLYFFNCQVFSGTNAYHAMTMDENEKLNVNPLLPVAKWLGGRYLCGSSWKFNSQALDGTEWGMCTDGDVVFDTSDGPSDTDSDVQDIITNHGSDADTWALIDRFLRVDSATEGLYQYGPGAVDDTGQRGDVNGMIAEYIGTAHPTLLGKKGYTLSDQYSLFDDNDGHPAGWQGCSYWTVQFLLAHHTGGGMVNYCITDSVNSQNCRQNTYQDFIVRDSNGKLWGTAGQMGVYIGQDGKGPRTAGNGLKDGNILRRFYIANIIGDPSEAYGSPAAVTDGVALPTESFEQGVTISDFTIKACTNAHLGGGGVTTDTTYTDYPSMLGAQVNISNGRYIQMEQYIYWHRAGYFSTDLGYIISNNNYVELKSSENTSTTQKWRVDNSTEQTWSDWKANSKDNSVAPETSVFDPNSTIQLGA